MYSLWSFSLGKGNHTVGHLMFRKYSIKPRVVTHVCNLRTQEAEAGGLPHVQDYIGTTKLVRSTKQCPVFLGRGCTKLYQRDRFLFWGGCLQVICEIWTLSIKWVHESNPQ